MSRAGSDRPRTDPSPDRGQQNPGGAPIVSAPARSLVCRARRGKSRVDRHVAARDHQVQIPCGGGRWKDGARGAPHHCRPSLSHLRPRCLAPSPSPQCFSFRLVRRSACPCRSARPPGLRTITASGPVRPPAAALARQPAHRPGRPPTVTRSRECPLARPVLESGTAGGINMHLIKRVVLCSPRAATPHFGKDAPGPCEGFPACEAATCSKNGSNARWLTMRQANFNSWFQASSTQAASARRWPPKRGMLEQMGKRVPLWNSEAHPLCRMQE